MKKEKLLKLLSRIHDIMPFVELVTGDLKKYEELTEIRFELDKAILGFDKHGIDKESYSVSRSIADARIKAIADAKIERELF